MPLFRPMSTLTLTSSTSSNGAALPQSTEAVAVVNGSTAAVLFCVFGIGSEATAAIAANDASAVGFAVHPGGRAVVRSPIGATHISVILPTGASASVAYVTCGEGDNS